MNPRILWIPLADSAELVNGKDGPGALIKRGREIPILDGNNDLEVDEHRGLYPKPGFD